MVEIKDLFDLDKTIAKKLFEGKTYPWEVLDEIKPFILKDQIGAISLDIIWVLFFSQHLHKKDKVILRRRLKKKCRRTAYFHRSMLCHGFILENGIFSQFIYNCPYCFFF